MKPRLFVYSVGINKKAIRSSDDEKPSGIVLLKVVVKLYFLVRISRVKATQIMVDFSIHFQQPIHDLNRKHKFIRVPRHRLDPTAARSCPIHNRSLLNRHPTIHQTHLTILHLSRRPPRRCYYLIP